MGCFFNPEFKIDTITMMSKEHELRIKISPKCLIGYEDI